MPTSTLGAVYVSPLFKLSTRSQHRDSLNCHDRGAIGHGRQNVSSVKKRPNFCLRMAKSKSIECKSVLRIGLRCQQQSSCIVRVSAVATQIVKEKAPTTFQAPVQKKVASVDGNGNGNPRYDMGGRGGKGKGGWGGWGGGGGGENWGPSSGGLILFGILLFLSYLKDLEKEKDDDDDDGQEYYDME